MAYVRGRDIKPNAIVRRHLTDDCVGADEIADDAVDFNHLAEDVIQEASGAIANAAVRTLNATPVTMIAAPGAGKMIVVHRVIWYLDYATAAFDAAAAGDTLVAKYTDGSGTAATAAIAGNTFGGASADTVAVAPGAAAIDAATGCVNAPLVAHINTGEWYSAAGGSALRWHAFYSVVTVPL